MCAGKIGAVTLKAHGVGPLMHAWPFSYKLMWLEEQAHCSTKTYSPSQSWTHASFRPTWMKKADLWGLSPVNSSSLYLNILSSVFLLCLGSDTVNLLLVCCCASWGESERERGWRTTLREQAGRSGEEPGDSEHVTGGQCGGRWWDEWLRCESLSLMEASTSTKLSSWSMWLAHLQLCVKLHAFSLWAQCLNIHLWIMYLIW